MVTTDETTPAHSRTGDLADQLVVVLGGSSGIGLATARRALGAGASVVIAARDSDRLARAADELEGEVDTAIVDVGDEASVAGFFARRDHVDHLLLSAGEPLFAPVAAVDLEQARGWLDERLRTLLFVARHAGPRLTPGGSLTLLSASGLSRPQPGGTLAGAWGASTEQVARTLALELEPARVNVIAPGFVETPLTTRFLGDRIAQRRQQLADTLPIGRPVETADIAALACHLMANTAITAAVIPIDGGQTLT